MLITIKIDLENDTMIGHFDVPMHYPGPRKPGRSTVFRWFERGVRVAGSDDRVKLPSAKLNGVRCTSIEALKAFVRIANGQKDAVAVNPMQRQRLAVAAGDACAAAGF